MQDRRTAGTYIMMIMLSMGVNLVQCHIYAVNMAVLL